MVFPLCCHIFYCSLLTGSLIMHWKCFRKPKQAQSPAGLKAVAWNKICADIKHTESSIPSGSSNLQVIWCSFKWTKQINGLWFYIIMYKSEKKTYSLKLKANYLLVLSITASHRSFHMKPKDFDIFIHASWAEKSKLMGFVGCIWEYFNSKHTVLNT